MAGDKKGKGKVVVQKKKKRTREDREREQAEAVADAADRQGSLRIRDPQAQGEPQQQLRRSGRTQIAQTTPESRSRPRTRGDGTQRVRGEQVMHSSSTPTVTLRQEVRTVVRSCLRLSYLISGVFQDLGSRD